MKARIQITRNKAMVSACSQITAPIKVTGRVDYFKEMDISSILKVMSSKQISTTAKLSSITNKFSLEWEMVKSTLVPGRIKNATEKENLDT